jgi:glyoxylase-like metal-dependent hydrolase (beta-lactamase superfamily II)
MLTRRATLQTAAASGAMLALGPRGAAGAASPLSWQAFPAGEAGFFRAPVLISGPKEAVLIDAGFSYPDGQTVIDAVRKSGKRLKTIYVTANDPDYYFSLAPIRKAFPQAEILAAPATVALMRGKAEAKVKAWTGLLGDNGPKTVDDLVFPTPSKAKTLLVDGQKVEIVEAAVPGDRGRYVWVPSLRAVFGGVLVFGGAYPWVADTPSPADRKAWLEALDAIAARKPKIVVPGHMATDWPLDASGVAFTHDYLAAFEVELAKAADSAALIAAMKQRYPKAVMGVSLELGAKVAKGEMKWD